MRFEGCTNLTEVIVGRTSNDNNYPPSATKYIFNSLKSDFVINSTTVQSLVFGSNVQQVHKELIGNKFASSISSVECKKEGIYISAQAFSSLKNLTNFKAKPSYIGFAAFDNCVKLVGSELDFSQCTSIGNSAFYSCSLLTAALNSTVLTSVGSEAFRNCEKLNSTVNIPNASTIGDRAFAGCTSLTKANIDGSSLGAYVFYGTDLKHLVINSNSLTSATYTTGNTLVDVIGKDVPTLEFGDNVKTIGKYAFYNSNVNTVCLNKVNTVYDYAFCECKKLKYIKNKSSESNDIATLDNIHYVGEKAFYNCPINGAYMPNLTSLGASAFANCSALTEFTAHKLATVSDYTFSGCTSLTSIGASNVKSIGVSAFSGCVNLKSTWFYNTIETIASSAFQGCSSMSSFSGKPKNIGDDAFQGCISLKTINLSLAVIIGAHAFENTKIIEVELPASLSSLGEKAFAEVTDVTINSSSLLKSRQSIVNCFGFKNDWKGAITIGDSITSIPEEAFCYTKTGNFLQIDSIHIGDNVKTIGNYGFYGIIAHKIYVGKSCQILSPKNTALKMYSDNLVEIRHGWNKDADYDMTEKLNLHSIFGPDVLEYKFEFDKGNNAYKSIPAFALYTESDTKLSTVSGSFLRYIGDNAFSGNSRLKAISLDSIMTIGEEAFLNCASLERVVIDSESNGKGEKLNIGSLAFKNCTGIKNVEIYNETYNDIAISAFTGVKPRLIVDMTDQLVISSNTNHKVYITNKEGKANAWKSLGLKNSSSIQRISHSVEDVNMNGSLEGDDVQKIYNAMK